MEAKVAGERMGMVVVHIMLLEILRHIHSKRVLWAGILYQIIHYNVLVLVWIGFVDP